MDPFFIRAIVLGAALLSGACAAACSDGLPTSPSLPQSSRTFLSLVSLPGDGVGNGFSQYAEKGDAEFVATRSTLLSDRQSMQVVIRSTTTPQWSWVIYFQVPQGQSLRAGAFENAMGYPASAGRPGLMIDGSRYRCLRPTGRFDVKELEFGTANSIPRLRVSFDVTCDNATVPFRGEIGIVPGA